MTSLIQPVLAQEINSKEDFEIWCSPEAYYYNAQHPDCEELRKIWVPETKENPVVRPREEPQTRENQRPREEHRFVEGTPTRQNYGTLTGGAFFPSTDSELVDLETGIGFSVNYGRLLGRNFALEAEFVPITGTIEAPLTYTFFGLIVAPVLRLPLSQSSKTALFISPGVGFGSVKLDLDNSDLFAEDTSFVFQVKAGFEVEISKSLTLLLQGRYLNTSAGDAVIFPDGSVLLDANIEVWSPEIGIRFWF